MKYNLPTSEGEAVIQAKLYTACEKAGLNCDLEYNVLRYPVVESRLDLIIIEDCEILAIVEVKTSDSMNALVENSEQIKRYKTYNVPVFILYSIYDISYIVKRLVEIRTKFLESCDPTKIKCLEADKQTEEKWNEKIAAAFSKFDELFPDYRFTNNYSLEIFATAVKIMGLPGLLKLMGEYSKDNVREFIFALKRFLKYKKEEELQLLRKCYGRWGVDEVNTVSSHYDKLNNIDENL